MRRFLLVWLISLFWFISFSNSQFIWPVKCEKFWCTNLWNCNYCEVPSNSDRVRCDEWTMAVILKDRNGNLSFWGWKTCPWSADPQNYVGWNYTIVWVAWVFDPWKIYYMWPTDKMPVSQLTPVLTWITDVLWEFIPYVIYIWLWVLIVSIAFVAVKWLMLWIYNKVRFIFKKR